MCNSFSSIHEPITQLRKDLDDLVPLHKGLDGMRLADIMTVHLGRLDQYTDDLMSNFVEWVEQCDTKTEMRILTSISQLSRRERLIIGRTFRKLHLSGKLLIKVKNPLMYECNKYTNFIFGMYIEMIESNNYFPQRPFKHKEVYYNNHDIANEISGIPLGNRTLMTIGYSGVMMTGDYK